MPEYDVALYQGPVVELQMHDLAADSPEEAAEQAVEYAVDLFRERLALEVWAANSPILAKPVYVVD